MRRTPRFVPAQLARRFRQGQLGPVPQPPDEKAGRWARLVWWSGRIGATAFKGSILWTWIIGIVKLILGMVILSPFVVVNGLYGLGMGVARFFCLATDEERHSLSSQYGRYRWIGLTVMIASLMYVGYALRLFFSPETTVYSSVVAISIATVVFIELGNAVYQTIYQRHNPSPLVSAAKFTSLASSLTALALAQVAIRQIADASNAYNSADAWGGLFCGGLATLVGVFMIVYATRKYQLVKVAEDNTSC